MAENKKYLQGFLVLGLLTFSLCKIMEIFTVINLFTRLIAIGIIFSISIPYWLLQLKRNISYNFYLKSILAIIALHMVLNYGYNYFILLSDKYFNYTALAIQLILSIVPASIMYTPYLPFKKHINNRYAK
ncbi:hypothetical protein [Flavobacterium sp. C4GT6]|uniref:hypothetical protein n=1 Tax=Flavobacterium sp. C4GT6 TaxID=3103818 RepID=UPI002ED2F930